jgi:hypothetical protein
MTIHARLGDLKGIETFWRQTETVRKVLKQFRGRVLLADEVSLGKTVEAGMALKEYLLRGMAERALVLVPASLVGQWREELESYLRRALNRGGAMWSHFRLRPCRASPDVVTPSGDSKAHSSGIVTRRACAPRAAKKCGRPHADHLAIAIECSHTLVSRIFVGKNVVTAIFLALRCTMPLNRENHP